MPLVDALLPEFDHEMTITRKLLERVPEEKFAWKPHGRSMSLGQLATHLAQLPWWGEMTLTQAEFDTAGMAGPGELASRAEVLREFDERVAKTRAALAGRSDAEMMAPWALKRGTHTIFSMPKAAVWRSFVLSHGIHHRGQLSVYLRLLDVPVPSIYGPSADEESL
jgi:uncharacterized damage-inducible protein DinB